MKTAWPCTCEIWQRQSSAGGALPRGNCGTDQGRTSSLRHCKKIRSLQALGPEISQKTSGQKICTVNALTTLLTNDLRPPPRYKSATGKPTEGKNNCGEQMALLPFTPFTPFYSIYSRPSFILFTLIYSHSLLFDPIYFNYFNLLLFTPIYSF
jgi:hypothetical protein